MRPLVTAAEQREAQQEAEQSDPDLQRVLRVSRFDAVSATTLFEEDTNPNARGPPAASTDVIDPRAGVSRGVCTLPCADTTHPSQTEGAGGAQLPQLRVPPQAHRPSSGESCRDSHQLHASVAASVPGSWERAPPASHSVSSDMTSDRHHVPTLVTLATSAVLALGLKPAAANPVVACRPGLVVESLHYEFAPQLVEAEPEAVETTYHLVGDRVVEPVIPDQTHVHDASESSLNSQTVTDYHVYAREEARAVFDKEPRHEGYTAAKWSQYGEEFEGDCHQWSQHRESLDHAVSQRAVQTCITAAVVGEGDLSTTSREAPGVAQPSVSFLPTRQGSPFQCLFCDGHVAAAVHGGPTA